MIFNRFLIQRALIIISAGLLAACAEQKSVATKAEALFSAEELEVHGYEITADYLFIQESLPLKEYREDVFLATQLLESRWPLSVSKYIAGKCGWLKENRTFKLKNMTFRNVRALKTVKLDQKVIKRWAIPKQQIDEIVESACNA